MATSKFFGAGGNSPENGVLIQVTFGTPSCFASAAAKSTSKPFGLSIGSSRKPATGNSAPAVSCPSVLRFTAEAGGFPAVEPPDDPPFPPSSPPQPAIADAASAIATNHSSFLTI